MICCLASTRELHKLTGVGRQKTGQSANLPDRTKADLIHARDRWETKHHCLLERKQFPISATSSHLHWMSTLDTYIHLPRATFY